MSNKKSLIQLYLSLALLFLVSNSSFSQVLMYCSNNNYSFQHMHNYLYIDADKDGYGSTQKSTTLQCTYKVPSGYSTMNTDCNDSNASINPGTIWYQDADGDSYGNVALTTTGCTKPTGYVSNYSDCNDLDGTVAIISTWYKDADGDGYGTSAISTTSCNQPSGYVRNSSDYNDGTANITNIAPSTFYRDADGDGYGSPTVTVYYSVKPSSGYVTNNLDCNDGDAGLNPNTPWFRDNDGDGYGSGGAPIFSCSQPVGYARNTGDCNDYDSSFSPATIWYRDADGDGYGISSTTTTSCTQPIGYVRNSSDYNDGTANITNIAPSTFYRDADGDGYGSTTVTVYYSVKPVGYVTNSLDCNDGDATLNPNTTWYRDVDGDGYGISTTTTNSCTQPSGYARNSGDCNDYDNTISPATIWYRDADRDGYGTIATTTNSCTQPIGYVRNSSDYNDGTANITNIAPQTFYADSDRDGFGNPNLSVYYSVQPTNYVTNNLDCNDGDATLNPNTIWYRDADGDGYGTIATTTNSCTQPIGYVRNSSDYNDGTANITNIAPQTFYADSDRDGFGNPNLSVYYSVQPTNYVTNNLDCNDGDATLSPNTIWYADADVDGYGSKTVFKTQCSQPTGYIRTTGDYDDTTVNITNIAPQTFYADSDRDGFGNPNLSVYYSVQPINYVTNSLDCNDGDATLNPNTIWYADADGDGFGSKTVFKTQCSQPTGYIRTTGDYDDTTVNITNIVPQTFYADSDGDTFGSKIVSVYYSVKPIGYVTNNSDFDDTTANITNIAPQIFYRDADNDGFGDASPNTPTLYYSVKPTGYVTNKTDCDDTKNTINPNTKWYADSDGDGLGDAKTFVTQCIAPAGKYVLNSTDNCPLVAGTSSDCGTLSNPAQDRNYIITRTYKQASTTSIASPTPTQAKVGITYYDGLGRPIQQIANQQSSTGKDIVTHMEYDAFGRQTKDYLPFVGTNRNMAFDGSAKNNTLAFYNTAKYENTANPFSEKAMEASPLNRVLKQAAPGTNWALGQGHEIKLDYQTNVANDVKLYTATATWNATSGLYTTALGNMAGTTFYAAKQLYKNLTYDENTAATPSETSGSTVEFKNKEGQVVLKRTYATTGGVESSMVQHDTYYVYDVYGNLTYVIPPKADMALTQAILDELCYQYQYDNRNRLVAKKLPGKQWEFMVYDKLDRVVATGPAFSPFSDVTASGWLITKYDAFNRVVYTGWLNSSATAATRKTMQDAQNTATTISESKQTSGTIDGISAYYSNAVAPTSFKLLTVNYYDNYVFPNIGIAQTIEGQTVATSVKGLATGSWTRVATTTAETKGETTHTLYDVKYHPVRTHNKNYLGGYTYTDSKVDAFTGQVQYTIERHRRLITDTELVVKQNFTYSAQDRLMKHTHQINGGAEQLLAENTYDELGQLVSKKVGNTSATPLQKVDYTYNIRGWMKSINNPNALQQGSDPGDLFGFKINYNTVEGSVAVANKLYNGNIAETFWSTATDGGFVRNYGYKYDNLNRLKDATYQKSNVVTNMYNENLTYDKNGNILTLKRNGDSDTQAGTIGIDNLTYAYATNSNKLMRVTEAQPTATSGFKDGNTTGDDYVYDANGNMTVDKNKKITAITYNHLNLPTKIVFPTGNIVYFYTASGQKVQKVVTENTTVTTTDYLGGYQYKNTVLQYFPTAEGYVKNTANVFSYVYNYNDHLGNVRLSYTKNPSTNALTILEESNYYPFGLMHKGYNNLVATNNPAEKLLYNGKELQDELGLDMYDFGARLFDRQLNIWRIPDPKAETSRRFSPYAYALNNPVFFIDPDGMEAIDWYKDKKGIMQFDPKVKSQADLGKRGTYVGATDKQTTVNGGTAEFRKDGSIMYSKEQDAYKRVMSNTKETGREQLAVIGYKSALVLPDYKNSGSEGSGGASMGYSFKNGNLQDPLTGKQFNTIGTIHAHMSGQGPSTYAPPGYGDLDFARFSTPNKPVFVMQNEKGVDGLSVIFASPYEKGIPVNYRVIDLTESMPNINSDNIQLGNTSLRNEAKSLDWKRMLK